jgi:hypothetical protein
MKKWLIALTLFLALGFAQSVEAGGELAPDGLRPYLVLSRAYPLGDSLYLVPSLFFYPTDLQATLRRGWFSLQLLGETSLFSWGLEGYLRGQDVALRFFFRLGAQ